MRAAPALGALALVLASSCNARFSFDEGAMSEPPDAAVAHDGAPRSVDAAGARDTGGGDDDRRQADAAPLVDAAPVRPDLASPPDLALAPPDVVSPAVDAAPAGPAMCSPQSQQCICSGTICSCGRQQWCQFAGDGCGPTAGSCTLLCHNGTRCQGQCQHGCHLECENGSSCTLTMGDASSAEGESSVLTLTVGTGSHVQCENNATCHITCTGSCTLSCQGGARCDLRCAGDASARSADGGGTCP